MLNPGRYDNYSGLDGFDAATKIIDSLSLEHIAGHVQWVQGRIILIVLPKKTLSNKLSSSVRSNDPAQHLYCLPDY
jgi:hypothetical protein